MGSQMSFGDLESQGQRRKTRREGLPERMDAIVPWDRWCALVEHPFLIVKRRSGHLRTRCRGPRRTPACPACPSPSRTWPCASPREGPSPPGPKLPERLRSAQPHARRRQGGRGKAASARAGRGPRPYARQRQLWQPGCRGAGRALIIVSLGMHDAAVAYSVRQISPGYEKASGAGLRRPSAVRCLYPAYSFGQRASASSSATTVQFVCSCRMEAGTFGVTGP